MRDDSEGHMLIVKMFTLWLTSSAKCSEHEKEYLLVL